MASLREMISGNTLVEAPVVFNPLTAKLAEDAGLPALYLGGGTFGYIQCYTGQFDADRDGASRRRYSHCLAPAADSRWRVRMGRSDASAPDDQHGRGGRFRRNRARRSAHAQARAPSYRYRAPDPH